MSGIWNRRSAKRQLPRTRGGSHLSTVRLNLEHLEDRTVPALTIQGATLAPTEGAALTGTVATVNEAGAAAADFSATIDWGDGTASPADGKPVTLVADPAVANQFDVQGTHTYAEEGHFNVQVTVTDTVRSLTVATASYEQTNLVTDNQTTLASLGFQPAAHTDPNLVNPWGIVASPTGSPFWISDNGMGVSTLYDGSGNAQALVVTIPVANGGTANGTGTPTSPANPTGVVFNGSTTDFLVNGAGTAAHFIFATEDGTIAAWNSGTSAVLKVDDADFTNGPVYKGLALGNNGTANFLYAANFRQGTIDVFDTNFTKVTLGSGGFGTFSDPNIPAGFAPFNIANIGGQLFVTYAMQDATKHDDVAGAGNGFVDVFDTNGNLVERFASQGTLNSPWGMAVAPSTFGTFAGDLLIGDFGDGRINAFNPTTGTFLGQLTDATGAPLAIDGLWGLSFGNNGTAGSAGTLFFTAGINGEADGLFGSLTAMQASTATVADAALVPGNVSSGVATPFTGTGGNNTATTAGSANAALTAFEQAVGGANNAANPATTSGFRAINWDAVPLTGTDAGFTDTVIDPNHVVGIPTNRFQERGVQFGQVYAVSGAASATDASTFSTVNPNVTNLFPAFSPANTFAAFNQNTIEVSFVVASAHTNAPVPAATRGFGAIFRNVEVPNTTSIEYFNGDASLGKFFVPVGPAGQAEFLGELFPSSIVTRVKITLGTDVLFSFDGVHFQAGAQADDPAHGHNLVVTDDFVYAEPVALASGQTAVTGAVAGGVFIGPVATFSDLDPNGTATDYTATINWGDGHVSAGTIAAATGGGFTVSGTNTFATAGTFPITVQVQDLGGSSVTLTNSVTVGQSPTVVFVNPAFTGAPGTTPPGSPAGTIIGVNAFATLGQGLSAVATGGTVMVAAGTYAENLVLSRSVIIQGAGSGTTILSGTNTGVGLQVTTANGVVVSGLTIKGFVTGLTAGSATTYLQLTDVRLSGNQFGGTVTGVNTFLVEGSSGNDTFFVNPTALAHQGDNSLSYSGVKFLTIDGGGGSMDALQVFLNDTTAADTVWMDPGAISRDKAFFLMFYRDTSGTLGGGLTVVLGTGPETINVQGQLTGVPTTVFAQGAAVVFNVAVTTSSAYQNLTLDGGGNGTVTVFDQSGGGTGQLQTLSDGTLEFDISYGGTVSSRIHIQNMTQVLSSLLGTIPSM